MEPQRRTVALFISQWNHPTTFYAWTWLKQYFLRRGIPGNGGTDQPADILLIVRVGKNLDDSDKWKVGGPLVSDVDTALQNYPHTILKLQGSIQSKMRSFIQEHKIDVCVLGDELPQSGFNLTSVTEWVKEKVPSPFVIIRPKAVRNAKMRIMTGEEELGSSPPSAASLEARVFSMPRAATGRKICISYERFEVGQLLMERAKQVALEPEDTVYVAHCYPSAGAAQQWLHPTHVMKQAGKLAKVMTFQRGSSRELDAMVTPENSIDFGARELEDYKVVLNVVLKGDPRSALERFCESEGIDLLIIGTRAGSKLKKTLTGGSVSSHLIDHAPCPCLVIPYKGLGLGGEEEGTSPRAASQLPYASLLSSYFSGDVASADAATQTESTASPPQAASVAAQIEVGGGGTAGASGEARPGQPHSTPSDMLAVLRQQLEEKDAIIAELREQVQKLQLAEAQHRETQTHDALHAPTSY